LQHPPRHFHECEHSKLEKKCGQHQNKDVPAETTANRPNSQQIPMVSIAFFFCLIQVLCQQSIKIVNQDISFLQLLIFVFYKQILIIEST
jgi:hypothetical protein